MHYYHIVDSPIDSLLLVSNGEAITGLYMHTHKATPAPDPAWRRDQGLFTDVTRQLRAYFAGELQRFTLPVSPAGTVFQKKVWEALDTIPFGTTVSYQQIAKQIGVPKAVRAVGSSNGKNPISIIVPCHRVIGANGRLTGYAGGLERKQWLLSHEHAVSITSKQVCA